MVIAVVLIVLALVYYLVSTIVALRQITAGLDEVIANTNTINLDWTASMRKQEKDMDQERRYSTVYFMNTENDVDYLSENKDDQKDISDKKLQWVSFQAHFFSGVLIAKQGFNKSDLAVTTDVTDTSHIKQMKADLALNRNADGSYPMEFYFGPVKYKFLKTQGYHLEKQVYMGWGFLAYINRFSRIAGI